MTRSTTIQQTNDDKAGQQTNHNKKQDNRQTMTKSKTTNKLGQETRQHTNHDKQQDSKQTMTKNNTTSKP